MSSPANDATRSEMTKKCSHLFVFAMCTAAWIMSLYAGSYCAFVNRDINFENGEDVSSVCNTLVIPQDECYNLLGEQGIGFWGWKMSDPWTCYSYTQYVEGPGAGYGYVTPDFDRKFNSARACQCVALVFGGIAWFTLAFSLCCKLAKVTNKILALAFFLAFLFQSLTFMIFQSSACDLGFFTAYVGREVPAGVASVSCSRSESTNMAIAAVVLYFCAMLMVLRTTAPNPFYNLGGKDDEAAVASPPATAEEEAPPAAAGANDEETPATNEAT